LCQTAFFDWQRASGMLDAKGDIMADNESERWITIVEAVAYFDRSDRTLRRWIKTGQISSKKVGGRVLVKVYDTESARESDRPGQAADVSALNAEVARLKEMLTETQTDRDYLRQALAAALSKIPTIEAVASETKQERRWWQFGK